MESLDAHLSRKRGQEAPFDVQKEIAHGGMGAVLLARDKALEREVAVKVIRPQVADSEEHRVRFLDEAQITAQLEHPNIVPVHDLGKNSQGDLYVTMKLVKGRSLGQIIEDLKNAEHSSCKGAQRPTKADRSSALQSGESSEASEKNSALESQATISLSELLNIFLKVCDGMAFAHSRGVIHRDLKPDNIMVGSFGEVLVMDWGLAKIVGREDAHAGELVTSSRVEKDAGQTLDGAAMGTPAYMPPEQAEGEISKIDHRSDIYSLGAILYEILTLRRPFQGKTPMEVMLKVSEGKLKPPEERAVAQLVHEGLVRTRHGSGMTVREPQLADERRAMISVMSVFDHERLNRLQETVLRRGFMLCAFSVME